MTKLWRKITAALLAVALLLGLLPLGGLPARAETVESVTYLNASGEEQTATNVTKVTSNDTTWSENGDNGGWYVVDGNIVIGSESSVQRVNVSGAVHLILTNNSSLTVNGGISVGGNNSLTIYAQSTDADTMGTLIVQNVATNCAGIGGGYTGSGGTININGGSVTANGGFYGAGIGGGMAGDGGRITINGGTIEAKGGNSGAGIGGGITGDGGTITINGGTIEAKGGNSGAGIGGGNSGGGGTITINSGAVTATGGSNGADIGCGNNGSSGTFSTGDNGNAMIFVNSISDTSSQDAWQGIIFQNGSGKLYGTMFTFSQDFTWPEGRVLTIDSGQILTIAERCTLTLSNGSRLSIYGTLNVQGAIEGSGIVGRYITGTLSGEDNIRVTIAKYASSVNLLESSLTLNVGESCELTATVLPEDTTESIAWSSTKSEVASVNNGKVTAMAPGTATIYATAGVASATCTVTVQPIHVESVILDHSTLALTVGAQKSLIATISPSNATDKSVSWSSSDETVATVSESGEVTAVANGSATITVTTTDGQKTASCEVTVSPATVAVTGVTLDRNNLSLTVGGSATLTATVLPENATDKTVKWSSSNDAVASVDDNGVIAANSAGTATITATAGDVSASCAVTVTAPTEPEEPTEPETPSTPSTPSQPTTPSEPEEPSGPSTGDSEGWDGIRDEIAGAEDGDTITIDMNGETEVPAEIFEEVAGKDVTIEFDMGDGVKWAVKGTDIPADARFSDLDLGVSMNTDGIPVDVINAITGEATSVQITLAHDGAFGFALTLSAPLGEENAGYWANLYHYNEDAEAMDFETAALIGDDGTVKLRLTHASQYAIVIDDHSHAPVTTLPFTDVNADDWFYDPVVWAYDEGLMTGTSATTFEPNTSTTRAMIVAILNRLEGGPTADGGTFTDVHTGDWYAEAVNWAASEGIVAGFEDGTFRPNDPITREQMAAILYNYAQWKGYDVSARADLSRYSDQPSEWAEDVSRWAVAEGLLTGITEDTLAPQASDKLPIE